MKVYVKEEDFADALSLAKAIVQLDREGHEVFLVRAATPLPLSPGTPYKTPPYSPGGWKPTIISSTTQPGGTPIESSRW